MLLPVERPDVAGNPAWTHAMFNDGNGGEFRKTFHGCETSRKLSGDGKRA